MWSWCVWCLETYLLVFSGPIVSCICLSPECLTSPVLWQTVQEIICRDQILCYLRSLEKTVATSQRKDKFLSLDVLGQLGHRDSPRPTITRKRITSLSYQGRMDVRNLISIFSLMLKKLCSHAGHSEDIEENFKGRKMFICFKPCTVIHLCYLH